MTRMNDMIELLLAAEEGGSHVVNELWFPPIVFGVLMMVVFVVLLACTFMFRNSAASHPVDSEVHPFQPYVHPGHAAHE